MSAIGSPKHKGSYCTVVLGSIVSEPLMVTPSGLFLPSFLRSSPYLLVLEHLS